MSGLVEQLFARIPEDERGIAIKSLTSHIPVGQFDQNAFDSVALIVEAVSVQPDVSFNLCTIPFCLQLGSGRTDVP
jgi:hypothetical protein